MYYFQYGINKLLKMRSPEHCLKLGRWQGSPNINKVKQYENVLFLKVSLFIHS